MNGQYSYQVATPEKALCDKLYTISPVTSVKELKNYCKKEKVSMSMYIVALYTYALYKTWRKVEEIESGKIADIKEE